MSDKSQRQPQKIGFEMFSEAFFQVDFHDLKFPRSPPGSSRIGAKNLASFGYFG